MECQSPRVTAIMLFKSLSIRHSSSTAPRLDVSQVTSAMLPLHFVQGFGLLRSADNVTRVEAWFRPLVSGLLKSLVSPKFHFNFCQILFEPLGLVVFERIDGIEDWMRLDSHFDSIE